MSKHITSETVPGDSVTVSAGADSHDSTLPYQVSPEPVSESPSCDPPSHDRYVLDDNYMYLQETAFSDYLDDIVTALDVESLMSSPSRKVTMDDFKKIILKEEVPVTACLVAVMGLPHSGKTEVLEKVIQGNIGLKNNAKHTINDYMKRKRDPNGLSIHELCVLGGPPHNQYAWSFATKRYGVIFSILSSLVRTSTCIKDISFETESIVKPLSFVEEHFHWLMNRVDRHMGNIKEEPAKLTLLQNGLSLINVMDVGVNKALYDFLPMMFAFCRKHVRLAFFSLERDGPNLHERPNLSYPRYKERKDDVIVMRRRARLTYLLHFATIGYKPNQCQELGGATLMVANSSSTAGDEFDSPTAAEAQISPQERRRLLSTCNPHDTPFEKAKKMILSQASALKVDQCLQEWFHVGDDDSPKVLGELLQTSIIRKNQFQRNLPLRWIFLRSLVVSLKKKESSPILVLRSSIIQVAKVLEMDEKEVDEFLTTFTDFGSILYMPNLSIKDIIIVDIWAFTQYLNKLFYPDDSCSYAVDLKKYGLVTQACAKEIFGDNEELFMKVVTSFAMSAEVKCGSSVILSDGRSLPPGKCYYLPSARVGENYDPPNTKNDFAFLEIKSVNFPANVQACISDHVMKNDNVYLLATEHCNTSRFEFRLPDGSITIEMIYGGSRTRLRVVNNSADVLISDAAVEACSKVLTACCECLKRKVNSNLIRDLKYNIAIPCCAPEDDHHFIYYDKRSGICEACLENKRENYFRLCWIKAAEKCELLKSDDTLRLEKDEPLTSQDIFLTGQELASLKKFKVSVVAEALDIKDEVEKLQEDGYKDTRLAMMMLMMWEKKAQEKATKGNLARKLKSIGYRLIAEKLAPTSLTY